jgi:hypothetical protein
MNAPVNRVRTMDFYIEETGTRERLTIPKDLARVFRFMALFYRIANRQNFFHFLGLVVLTTNSHTIQLGHSQ